MLSQQLGLWSTAACEYWWATMGVLCSVCDSLPQERHGHTGESPVNSHKYDEGTGVSPMHKGWEIWNCLA